MLHADDRLERHVHSLRGDDTNGRLTGQHACRVCGMRYDQVAEARDCCQLLLDAEAELLARKVRPSVSANRGWDKRW